MRNSKNDFGYLTKIELDVIRILSEHGACTYHQAIEFLSDSKSSILVLRAMHDLLDKKVLDRVKVDEQQFYSLRKSKSQRMKVLTQLSLQSVA